MDESMDTTAENGAAGETTEAAGGLPDLSADGIQSFWEDNQDMIVSYAVSAAGAIVFLFIAFIVAGIVRRATTGTLRKAKVDETLARFLGTIARWGIVILALVAAMGMFGIKTTSFVAIIGAAGLAIALSFQGTLGSLAAGVMLLLFRPFKVGDFIKTAGEAGTVFEIGLVATALDTPDNRRVIIPNGAIFGSTIENVSHHEERRVDVGVGCDYSADIDKTREVLERAAQSVEGRLAHRDPQIVLGDLGDSSVNWTVRVWTSSADFWAVKERTTRAVKMHLDDAGIGIPFPQMDVHVNKLD